MPINIETFLSSYIAAALWSSVDDGGEPLDSIYSVDDIAPATVEQMRDECADFIESAKDLLDRAMQVKQYTAEKAAQDFWLTRNHHGAGFWDSGLGALGQALTDAAQTYDSVYLYLGDDGLIHQQ